MSDDPLQKLEELYNGGYITEFEYNIRKAEIGEPEVKEPVNPKVQQFMDMTGLTEEIARDYLLQHRDNLEVAINNWLGEAVNDGFVQDTDLTEDYSEGSDQDDMITDEKPKIRELNEVEKAQRMKGSSAACVNLTMILKEVEPHLPIEVILLISFNYYCSFKGRTVTIAGIDVGGKLDGDVKVASISYPMSICLDPERNIVFSDYTEHVIRKLSYNLKTISTIAGSGMQGYEDKVGKQASFYNPIGICCNHNGDIFVADYGNNRIRKITPAGEVSTYPPLTEGQGYQDGKNPRFNGPYGLVFDIEGNLLIADCQNHKIRKVDQTTLEVTTIAGDIMGCEDGDALQARFSCPVGLAVDQKGVIYVSDFNNSRIRKISKEGKVTTVAGIDHGWIDGDSTVAKFNNPVGICICGNDLIVADYNNQKIRRMSLHDGSVSTICGEGKGEKDGDEFEAQFSSPIGICNYGKGAILVTDASNHKLRKVFI